MKPIPFNTNSVRDILDGRKTATRRVIKREVVDAILSSPARRENPDVPDAKFIWCLCDAPYETGDILYVRETWAHPSEAEIANGADPEMYIYKADSLRPAAWNRWRPSIHMPKEAARIFLRVTDVRVERLQDITEDQARAEGCCTFADKLGDGKFEDVIEFDLTARDAFSDLWSSTIKPADLPLYDWEADPWVWVIEFERVSKEEALKGG